MSVEHVREFFRKQGAEHLVVETEASSATVQEAARAIGTEERRIAKTLSFVQGEAAVLIVVAGDARIDNRKYKDTFGQKAKMIDFSIAEELTGHAPGGICPFGVKAGVRVFLDDSLKRFESVYPAAGSGNSHVHVTLPELEQYSRSLGWVDVTKLPED